MSYAIQYSSSFREMQNNEKVLDQFVLYNDLGYSDLREYLEKAAYAKQMDPLIQSTNVSLAQLPTDSC